MALIKVKIRRTKLCISEGNTVGKKGGIPTVCLDRILYFFICVRENRRYRIMELGWRWDSHNGSHSESTPTGYQYRMLA
jgi:hypothetical protein